MCVCVHSGARTLISPQLRIIIITQGQPNANKSVRLLCLQMSLIGVCGSLLQKKKSSALHTAGYSQIISQLLLLLLLFLHEHLQYGAVLNQSQLHRKLFCLFLIVWDFCLFFFHYYFYFHALQVGVTIALSIKASE